MALRRITSAGNSSDCARHRGLWRNLLGQGCLGREHGGTGVFGHATSGDGVRGDCGDAGKSGVYGSQSDVGSWAINGSNLGALTNGYFGAANGMLGLARGSTGSGVVGFAGTASPADWAGQRRRRRRCRGWARGRVQRQCRPESDRLRHAVEPRPVLASIDRRYSRRLLAGSGHRPEGRFPTRYGPSLGAK